MFFAIHMGAVSQKVLMNLIDNMSLEITLLKSTKIISPKAKELWSYAVCANDYAHCSWFIVFFVVWYWYIHQGLFNDSKLSIV